MHPFIQPGCLPLPQSSKPETGHSFNPVLLKTWDSHFLDSDNPHECLIVSHPLIHCQKFPEIFPCPSHLPRGVGTENPLEIWGSFPVLGTFIYNFLEVPNFFHQLGIPFFRASLSQLFHLESVGDISPTTLQSWH